MRIWKKIAAVMLSLMMMLSFSGCMSSSGWSMTIDGEKVPAGVYLTYIMNAYSQAAEQVTDSSKAVLKQQVDGQDASVWIVNTAIQSCKSYAFIRTETAKRNITLTDDEKTKIQKNLDTTWENSGTIYTKNGISQDSLKKVLEINALSPKLFAAVYGKGGEKEVSDQNVNDYLVNNFYIIKYFRIPLTDSSGNELTDDEMNQKRADADSYLKQLQGGAGFEAVADACYTKLSVDFDSTDPYRYVTALDKNSASISADVLNYVSSMPVGSYGQTESDQVVYVFYRMDPLSDAGYLAQQRTNLLQEYKGEEFDTWVKDQANAMTNVEMNQKAINRYKPKKIKMN